MDNWAECRNHAMLLPRVLCLLVSNIGTRQCLQETAKGWSYVLAKGQSYVLAIRATARLQIWESNLEVRLTQICARILQFTGRVINGLFTGL